MHQRQDMEALLPSDADVALYRERGYHVSPKVLRDEVIDEAVRGAERHFAGERDFRLPVTSGFADWKPGDPDAIRNSEFVTLQNAQIRPWPSSRSSAPSQPASQAVIRFGCGTISWSRSHRRRRRATGPRRRVAHRSSVLDDLYLATRCSRPGSRSTTVLSRWVPSSTSKGAIAGLKLTPCERFNSQDLDELQRRFLGEGADSLQARD